MKILANSQLIFIKRTKNLLRTISFTQDDIAKIIENFNPNKANGIDMISVTMLKIYSDSIFKPLELIFKSCIKSGKFLIEWKKANLFPVNEKSNKQLIENYRPISLLAVCGKILEAISYK